MMGTMNNPYASPKIEVPDSGESNTTFGVTEISNFLRKAVMGLLMAASIYGGSDLKNRFRDGYIRPTPFGNPRARVFEGMFVRAADKHPSSVACFADELLAAALTDVAWISGQASK